MATVDKLFKAIEALKISQSVAANDSLPNAATDETSSKKKDVVIDKKDKIAFCNVIADAICSSTISVAKDFPKYLGIALETFLSCCDDNDADVRMLADECLNRSIKGLLETHLGRIQVELYKSIKKNGRPRSLKASLWRFAELCHLIRSQKCRPYIVNLLPCLVELARRPEESVQETLANSLDKILKILGKFTTDREIMILLRAFVTNLKSVSPVVRRTASSCLMSICLHSRKPLHFFAWLLNTLLNIVVPVSDPSVTLTVNLGVLVCLREIIPNLSMPSNQDSRLQESFGSRTVEHEYRVTTDQLIHVYELLLFFLRHFDHNIVATALETLNQLLRTPPPLLLPCLVNPQGIRLTQIHSYVPGSTFNKGGSELGSIASLAGCDEIFDDECDTYTFDQSSSLTSADPRIPNSDLKTATSSLQDSIAVLPENALTERTILHQEIITGGAAFSEMQIDHCHEEEQLEGFDNSGIISRPPEVRTVTHKGDLQSRDPCCFVDPTVELSRGSDTAELSVLSETENIGTFLDSDVPLFYCARLLCSSFLLTGSKKGIIPDKIARVSVKSLALGCLANVVSLCPRAFCLQLFLEDKYNNDVQCISDVVLFSKNTDPQLRGVTATVIGEFLFAASCEAKGSVDNWMSSQMACTSCDVTVEHFVDLITGLLQDSATVACRLALIAVHRFANQILNSTHGYLGLKLLRALIPLRDSPYWLVKVELLELLADIPFAVIFYLENLTSEDISRGAHFCDFQSQALERVFLLLLGDDDFRVRNAAATTFTKLISNLFYARDHIQQDAIIFLAREKTAFLLEDILNGGYALVATRELHSNVEVNEKQSLKCVAESVLSRVLHLLISTLASSTEKNLTSGCLQTLSIFSSVYPFTAYKNAWSCHLSTLLSISSSYIFSMKYLEVPDTEKGSLPFFLTILNSTSVGFDLVTHTKGIRLVTNLFTGLVVCCLQSLPLQSVEVGTEAPWFILKERHLKCIAESLLRHLMRLLNIFAHIIEDHHPGPVQVKSTLPSLPSAPTLSPIKSRPKIGIDAIPSNLLSSRSLGRGSSGKDRDEKSSTSTSQSTGGNIGMSNIGILLNTMGTTGMGSFYNLPSYMKLYDVLKAAHANYRLSLDFENMDKFSLLLHGALSSLVKVLEVATAAEVGPIAEEILCYLRITVKLQPSVTIVCVKQLLKALFGTNSVTQYQSCTAEGSNKTEHSTVPSVITKPSLFNYCFTAPCKELANIVGNNVYTPTSKDGGNLTGQLRRKWERKLPAIGKVSGKSHKNSLASHIRLFESLVIKALKLYTVTSSVDLQCQVLQLLAQLVQLRVNYCLLDSEHIFIAFVIKQFEFIEGGQIPKTELLIPNIFHFLVLLSYERYHSKSIIGVPKIIQLCDGIMASGQPPITHAIPSLLPIVEDLFLVRGSIYKNDTGKELDIQREVIVSMLFRFIHYHQILEMFIIILQENSKECDERWRKLSRQVVDTLLPILIKQQVNVDDKAGLDTLYRLFEAVAPSVFRPMDDFLHALLAPPHDLSTLVGVQRWTSLVLVIVRIILSQSVEEVILSRLAELRFSIFVFSDTLAIHQQLCLHSSENLTFLKSECLPSEETLARFLLQVIGIVAQQIVQSCFSAITQRNELDFLCQQMSHLLLYITHMFQSGTFRHVTNTCISIAKHSHTNCSERFFSITDINVLFLELASAHPTIMLQWCNILVLLNYDNQDFWSRLLQDPHQYHRSLTTQKTSAIDNHSDICSANLEIVYKGSLIIFCDYICENLNDAEHMTWLIVHCITALIELSAEPPVHDLICNVQRNSAASGLFVQAVSSRCSSFCKPGLRRKMFACLDGIHANQSGAVLLLLVERFLDTPNQAIARTCASMACRRVEVLLAQTLEESSSQLTLDDIDKLLSILYTNSVAKRYDRFVVLILKLRNQLHPFAQPYLLNQRIFYLKGQETISESFDKVSYMKFVITNCCESQDGPVSCAQLLSKLEYDDMVSIMDLENFPLPILGECISLGGKLFLVQVSNGTISEYESPLSPLPKSSGGFSLYTAAKMTLLLRLNQFIASVPTLSSVYNICGIPRGTKEGKYLHRLSTVFDNKSTMATLEEMCFLLQKYFNLFQQHPVFSDVPINYGKDIFRFTVLVLEAAHWSLHMSSVVVSPLFLQSALELLHFILHENSFTSVCYQPESINWISTVIYGVYCLFKFVYIEAELDKYVLAQNTWQTNDEDGQHIMNACMKLSAMLFYLEQTKNNFGAPFLSSLFKSVIQGLGRIQCVNVYVRTPPLVWQLGLIPNLSEDTNAHVPVIPPVPVDFILEKDVLCQFIFRVNFLGWTSRQQFEETWMILLGILSAVSAGENSFSDDDSDYLNIACLTLKCITSLLQQSFLLPQPGNPNNSHFLRQPHDKPVAYLHTRQGRKFVSVLKRVQKFNTSLDAQIERSYYECQFDSEDPLPSITISKKFRTKFYGHSQVSLEYLLATIGNQEEISFRNTMLCLSERSTSLTASGLDLHSCLHFLLDFFSQWLVPNSISSTQLAFLTEAVRSVVMLCDIFTEKAQFEWMLQSLLELYRCHPSEDEIVSQYLALGICKAAAVISTEGDLAEEIRKVFERCLKSTYLSTRIMALHGLLYLLELGPTETVKTLLSFICDYLSKQLFNDISLYNQSKDHAYVLWSVAFYLIENFKGHLPDFDFSTNGVQAVLKHIPSSDELSPSISVFLTSGLERLLLTNSLCHKDYDCILKANIDRFSKPNPAVSSRSLELLLSCLYCDKDEDKWLQESATALDDSNYPGSNMESLNRTMEKITILFNRMKRGYPHEAAIITSILPNLLTNFFPLSDVMNKVIGEFLSSQQPHPQFVASVVFKVFEFAYEQNQHDLVREWVLLSLSNFTQQSPVSMAIWSLSCLFLSASVNPWLKAIFPYLQQRIGKLESFDVDVFCIVGIDFYYQLSEESSRSAFYVSISSVAHEGSAYRNLLVRLPKPYL